MSNWIRLSCDRCGSPNHLYEPDIPSGPEAREVIRFCPKCRAGRQRAVDAESREGEVAL